MPPPTFDQYLAFYDKRRKLREFDMMPRERFRIYYLELKLGKLVACKAFKRNIGGFSCAIGTATLAEVLFSFGESLKPTCEALFNDRVSKLWVE